MPPDATIAVALAAAVVAVGYGGLAVRRRRQGAFALRPLSDADTKRYAAMAQALAAEAESNPQVAAARARGVVEEVLRRRGFPDRVDPRQKARDVEQVDRALAALLREADAQIRLEPATSDGLRRAVAVYGEALSRLLAI